jgi:hypothetical protein
MNNCTFYTIKLYTSSDRYHKSCRKYKSTNGTNMDTPEPKRSNHPPVILMVKHSIIDFELRIIPKNCLWNSPRFADYHDNSTRSSQIEHAKILRIIAIEKKRTFLVCQHFINNKMNHVAQRANSILQKPSPHLDIHWLRFPIRACIDSHPCIRAYMDSGSKQMHFASSRKWFYVVASSNDVIASKF